MTDEPDTPPPNAASVKLTMEEHFAITDHINRKAVSPNDACFVCGSPDNTVTENIYRVDTFTNTAVLGAAYQPLFSTVCNNCGFVRFFNKIFVDLLISQHLAAGEQPPEPEAGDGS